MTNPRDPQMPNQPPVVEAEPVETQLLPGRWNHLSENRGLIVRRALLSTAISGAVPVPVLDDIVAVRVRAGLFMKLAERRGVGLPAPSAEVLAEAKEGSRWKNVTITAATLVAIKLAWRKFFAVLALGRGAEDAATNFQAGLLVDHYCARLHVGPALDRKQAAALRRVVHETVESTHRDALVSIFRDGTRTLGRSLLQAPRWMGERMSVLAQRWVQTRGNVEATFEEADLKVDESLERRWLDKATQVVEAQLAGLGNGYLDILVPRFEAAWARAAAKLSEQAEQNGRNSPEGESGPANGGSPPTAKGN